MKLSGMCGCLLVCASLVWPTTGCKSGSESETVTRSPVKASKDAGPVSVEAGPPTPEYTAEQEARYRKHLRVGRARSKKRHFGEATREFEKALEAVPTGARALSELGWAAFQAGDYTRARAANQDAIRWASNREVRAASMYNLGRIAEAIGDRQEASRQYRASLEIRPNDTVSKRLNDLQKPVAKKPATERVACGAHAVIEELCQCLTIKRDATSERRPTSCQRESRDIPGVELLFVGDDTEEWVHLVSTGEGGWSSVAVLGYVFDSVDTGVHEEFELGRFEIRKIQEHEVLWIETVQTRTEEHSHPRNKESSRVHSLVLCPWSPDRTGGRRTVACALEVPLTDSYERVSHSDTPRRKRRSNPDVRTMRELSVEVRDDGTVKVVLVHGDRNDAVASLLGEHRLW